MIIAIDLDNTLFTCNSVLYKVLTKIQTPSKINKKVKYTPVENDSKINTNWLKFLSSIFNPSKYVENKNAIESINKLGNDCNKIIFLSSRPYRLKTLRSITQQWLQDNNVKYDAIFFGCENKAVFCSMFNVDVIIDDKTATCVNALSCGVDAINLIANEGKAKQIRKKHIDNKNLHIVTSWKAIPLLCSFIKLQRFKCPEDYDKIRKDLFNDLLYLQDNAKKQQLILYLAEQKIAQDIVINNNKTHIPIKFNNITKK